MLREFLKYLSLELNRSPLTVEAYESDLRGFNEFLVKSGAPVGDAGFFVPTAVTSADVREWMASLSEEGVSAVSIRRKVQSLRAYYKFLMKGGHAASNPASSLPLPRSGRRLPTIASHTDILESIDASEKVVESFALKMLYGCGLRRAELLQINDSDINPFTRELKVLGKGGKHRLIPLPPALMEEIGAWQKWRDAKYPDLPSPRPLMATSRGRMSASTLYNIVKGALAASTAEKKSPHTLRHSFATQLLNSGADINSVKSLLGHSSLGATQIYTHLAFSELSREWAKAHPRARGKKEK